MMKVDFIGASSALWSMIKKQIKPAVVMFLLLTILVGIVYPLVVTGIAQVIFPAQANGDLIVHDGNVAGSSLIGQPFSSPDYFWGRQHHRCPTMPKLPAVQITAHRTRPSSLRYRPG
jgi:K+-transporting ATPase c subunit